MLNRAERKFGAIPDWAKTGQVSLRNYDYRAEWHCSQQGAKREGLHPTIKRGSPDFAVWQQYFEHHLGGRPLAFKMLLSAQIEEMTVPEQIPQWFDASFAPDPRWRPAQPQGVRHG